MFGTTPDKIILLDIDDTLFNTGKFYSTNFETFEMYEEVHDVLKTLSKIATLGIFSQGEIAFQKKKLIETNIAHLFRDEHMHIVEEKISAVKHVIDTYKDLGKLFVVEDRLDILHTVKKYDPSVVTVWMKRGRYIKQQREISKYIPDHTIENLRELYPIINIA